MDKKYKVAGYVKLAKLWERSADTAIPYHHQYYEKKLADSTDFELYDVFIDITGKKETAKRTSLVCLLKACEEGKVNCIFTQTKAYLAANPREFCYLIKFLFSLHNRIDIVTEDADYNINTIENRESQREYLKKMADDMIYLNPPDFQEWLSDLRRSINDIYEN